MHGSARLRSACFLFLLAAAVQLSAAARALAENRIALVLGNDRYAHLPADQQLGKAVNDATAVGDVLVRLGFEVLRGSNLDRQGMIDKLAELTGRLRAGDTAVLFYAGHGVGIGGVNYLLPGDVPSVSVGAETRLRGASISEPEIIDEIQAKGPRVAFLVLDACRDNPFPRSGSRSVGSTSGLVEAEAARDVFDPNRAGGVFAIYSAGIGQTALDELQPNDPNRNSVFTRVFVEQLARPGLDLGALAIEVRERVADLALNARNGAGQVDPHVQTPAYYDQTLGRLYLAGLPKPPPDTVSPPVAAAASPGTTAVAFRVSGTLVERRVDFGTMVKIGDLLARVDSRPYLVGVAQAQAQVGAAQAAVAQATAQEARNRKLLASRGITSAQYESVRSVRQKAEADLASLQALLGNEKENFAAAELRAELDGKVTAVGVEVGNIVRPGDMVVEITREPAAAADRRGTAKSDGTK